MWHFLFKPTKFYLSPCTNLSEIKFIHLTHAQVFRFLVRCLESRWQPHPPVGFPLPPFSHRIWGLSPFHWGRIGLKSCWLPWAPLFVSPEETSNLYQAGLQKPSLVLFDIHFIISKLRKERSHFIQERALCTKSRDDSVLSGRGTNEGLMKPIFKRWNYSIYHKT